MEAKNIDQFKILFLVTAEDTLEHYYSVQIIFQANQDKTQLVFPSWTPGSYMLRDYSRHLHNFHATVKWEQTQLSEWTVQGVGEVQIEYKIYAFEDLTVRTNYLDEDFGFINPCALFLYPRGWEKAEIEVRFILGKQFPRVFSSLPRISEDRFLANGFDHLYDSPFQLTHSIPYSFDCQGIQHELLIEGDVSEKFRDRLLKDLSTITTKQSEVMDGNPNSYYLFVLILTEGGYGGLEHSASSINIFDSTKIEDSKEYLKLLELLSHEYFHLWNVKRIRPIALGPFDYEAPNLTKELWIAEGITSFYDAYFLLKSGLMKKEEYLDKLMEDISILEENQGEEVMSLEEASFTAWNKFYKRNANSHNTGVSYYTKGAILVLCMNLRIIQETEGKKDFSHILRALLLEFHEKKSRGITKMEFFDTAFAVTGFDLRKEFDSYLTTARRIPVYDYLSILGIYKIEENEVVDWGFQCKESQGTLIIQKIFAGRIDKKANLYLGDEILALNGVRVSNLSQWNSFSSKKQLGEKVTILYSRKSTVRETKIQLGSIFLKKRLELLEDDAEDWETLQKIFFD